jgi:hypothetical protein
MGGLLRRSHFKFSGGPRFREVCGFDGASAHGASFSSFLDLFIFTTISNVGSVEQRIQSVGLLLSKGEKRGSNGYNNLSPVLIGIPDLGLFL